jgi:diacylglycerol O-acyltransferase
MKLVMLAAADRPLEIEALRASVAARLEPGSRGLERVEVTDRRAETARWVADEGFDVSGHVRRREPTAGIDERGAWAVAAELMSERLDHGRPLWAFDVIGPLADGREAIVARIHHAMADGISCVRFLDEVLWDDEAKADRATRPTESRARDAGHGHQLRRLPGTLARELGHRASDSILDRPIGATRELAFTAAPLARLHAIGASRPGHTTVNDVLLAGIAGGLRSWLAAAGERVGMLRAQVPVSLHHRDEDAGALGNRDSFLNVDLPLAEPDPLARLDAISAETGARKRLGDAEEMYDLFHALGRCKPIERSVERLAAGPREFSVSISNVPGPRGPLAVCGREVEQLRSVAEPAARHALRVSAISCSGTVGIGLCADPEAVPGIARLAGAIEEAVAELGEAAKVASR